MKFNDAERLELSELCSALVDETLTESQGTRLAEILGRSAEARQFYVRTLALSASLFGYASELQSEPQDATSIPENERPAGRLWTVGVLAAAALVTLAFWLGGFEKRESKEAALIAEQDVDESVARLTGGKDLRWSGGSLSVGDELRRGQQIKLVSGFAEITFDSGAEVVLEGPAVLDLTSAWDAVLRHGALRANVPPEAVGFRVSNSAVEVVDLGTQFSMFADEHGATDVFVLKGAVEASARDTNGQTSTPVTLREMQSSRFARTGVSAVRDREKKLARLGRKVAFERAAASPDYVHWSFDEPQGSQAHAEFIGALRGGFDARLTPAASESRIAGRWENALHFDGHLFARASFPRSKKRVAHTVAFWTRVPADAPIAGTSAMLSWQVPGKVSRLAAISWNADPAQGALGALRTTIGRTVRVGTTPLRDGKWHHLAVVLPPARGDAKLEIKSYVDGRLEGVSTRGAARRRGVIEPDEVTVAGSDLWMGRTPGAADKGGRFRGDLDELFIANRELSPREIRFLLRENRPAPAAWLAPD